MLLRGWSSEGTSHYRIHSACLIKSQQSQKRSVAVQATLLAGHRASKWLDPTGFRSKSIWPQSLCVYVCVYIHIYIYIYNTSPPSGPEFLPLSRLYAGKIPYVLYKIYQVCKMLTHPLLPLCFIHPRRLARFFPS